MRTFMGVLALSLAMSAPAWAERYDLEVPAYGGPVEVGAKFEVDPVYPVATLNQATYTWDIDKAAKFGSTAYPNLPASDSTYVEPAASAVATTK